MIDPHPHQASAWAKSRQRESIGSTTNCLPHPQARSTSRTTSWWAYMYWHCFLLTVLLSIVCWTWDNGIGLPALKWEGRCYSCLVGPMAEKIDGLINSDEVICVLPFMRVWCWTTKLSNRESSQWLLGDTLRMEDSVLFFSYGIVTHKRTDKEIVSNT